MKKPVFLIWGAGLSNKGAQAMLFVTVSELRNRFPDCEIYYNSSQKTDEDYHFKRIACRNADLIEMRKFSVLFHIKGIAALIIKRKSTLFRYYKAKGIFRQLTAIIDISGYALGSQWGAGGSHNYLDLIETAKEFGIPVFLMPQSFGPFEYGEEQEQIDQRLRILMRYPIRIFAREWSGYNELKEKYELTNVEKSPDLVLQNKDIIWKYISDKDPCSKNTRLSTKRNAAIIPNLRNIDHGGAKEEKMYFLYGEIIKELVSKGFNVYILRHSKEDLEICNKIAGTVPDCDKVRLLTEDYNCMEFNEIVKQFCFIIGSRYHSIIHAYKNSVPALALGWAKKYHELLADFDQSQYMFDVREDIKPELILAAIDHLSGCYSDESKKIQKKISEFQQNNCFDVVSDYFTENR